VMSVHEGSECEYEKRHNPIWIELQQVLKQHGVHNYSIFLHPQTRQLFGYVEIESEERWEAIGKTAACQKWWKFMSPLMPGVKDAHGVETIVPESTQLRSVFHLP